MFTDSICQVVDAVTMISVTVVIDVTAEVALTTMPVTVISIADAVITVTVDDVMCILQNISF